MTNPTPTSPWLNMRFLNHVLYLICLLYLAPSSVLIITRDVLPKTVSRQCLLKGECFNPIASVAASDCVSITKNKHGTKYMQIFSNIRQTGNLFPSTLLKQTLSNQIVFVADSDGVRNEASKHESISRQKRPEPRYKMSHIRRGCFCLALVLAFFPPFPYCLCACLRVGLYHFHCIQIFLEVPQCPPIEYMSTISIRDMIRDTFGVFLFYMIVRVGLCTKITENSSIWIQRL